GARILNSKFLILNFVFGASVSAAACRGAVPASVEAQAERIQSAPKKEPAAGLKPLKLTHAKTAKPVVGAETDAAADGLPPNRTVDLTWETVDGGWVVEGGYRLRGKRCSDRTKALGRAQVGPERRLGADSTGH